MAREIIAQTVQDTDPRTGDYGIVRADLGNGLVEVEWLTGSWSGHVTAWAASELRPLGYGVRPTDRQVARRVAGLPDVPAA